MREQNEPARFELEPVLSRIPARSRRQAMDWSLVLISQGIQSTIEAPGPQAGWGLLVNAHEHPEALRAIAQYKFENRGWSWRQQWRRPALIFDWGSVAWVLLLVLFFWLAPRPELQSLGCMDNQAVWRGQWWRLFTAIWLHADLGHLGTNATVGLVLLGLTMGGYGTGIGLLGAYLAGAGGNLAVLLLGSTTHRSLGASGMIMGTLGMLAVQSLSRWRQGAHAAKYLLSGLAGGLMLFVLFGLTPGTDVLAHAGGFVSGVILGALARVGCRRSQPRGAELLAGLVFMVGVILPWWLAFSHWR